MITRDASPYPASTLEISGFRCSLIRERRSLAPLRRRVDAATGMSPPRLKPPYTELATRSPMHYGRFKGFLPSNSWNDSTNGGGASMAAPAQTGTRCPTRSAKTQIPHRVCKHGAEQCMSVQNDSYCQDIGLRMTLPCVPIGISFGNWHCDGKSRGISL